MSAASDSMARLLTPHSGRKRRSAALGCVFVLTAGLASAEPKPDLTKLGAVAIEVKSAAISRFSRTGTATTFGKLEWRGGISLTAPHPNFGGWSGLALDPDGRKFVAVSDGGAWMTGEMAYDGEMLSGIKNAQLGPLLSMDGKTLRRGRDKDAEAVAIVNGSAMGGALLVSFERNARIARYEISATGVSPSKGFLPLPAETRKMSRNRGLEAMTVIKGGRRKGSVISFAERLLDGNGDHAGWLWTGDKSQRLTLKNKDKYDITDVASLDDGSLIVLERRFGWLEGIYMRLRHIGAQAVGTGAPLDGEVLIEASLENEIDNMEGLAVSRGRSGETILTLISDNNFNSFLQRTVLLQFALPAPKTAKARP